MNCAKYFVNANILNVTEIDKRKETFVLKYLKSCTIDFINGVSHTLT